LGSAFDFIPAPADGAHEGRITVEAGADGMVATELVGGGWLVRDRLAAGRLTLTAYTDDGWSVSVLVQGDRQRRHNNYTLFYEAPGFPVSGSDVIPQNTRDSAQGILRVEREFEGFRFTSLTSFRDMRLKGDVDGSDSLLFAALTSLPTDFFSNPDTDYTRITEGQRVLSQELRLSLLEGAAVSWVAGVNWLRTEYTGHRGTENALNLYSNGTTDVDITSHSATAFPAPMRGTLGVLGSRMVNAAPGSGREGNRVPLAAGLTAGLGLEYSVTMGMGELRATDMGARRACALCLCKQPDQHPARPVRRDLFA